MSPSQPTGKALTNLFNHRKAICDAMGRQYDNDMIVDEYFLGSFSAEQQRQLEVMGLVNRGFCPICGTEPIGCESFRKSRWSGVVEYVCGDCEAKLNPMNDPGFATRHHAAKGCIWLPIILFMSVIMFVYRSCN